MATCCVDLLGSQHENPSPTDPTHQTSSRSCRVHCSCVDRPVSRPALQAAPREHRATKFELSLTLHVEMSISMASVTPQLCATLFACSGC